ncbi:MAG: hypothetical protein AAGK05_11365 [Pseudomonadota bacterium]
MQNIEKMHFLTMSFHHVLASNVSPNIFPNNNASKFSTPLHHPYEMKGKYEVALMNMTYSACVNTFSNDELKTVLPYSSHRLSNTKVPVRLRLNKDNNVEGFLQEMMTKLEGIIKFHFIGGYITWKEMKSDLCIVFSEHLTKKLKLQTSVITPWDMIPWSCETLDLKALLGEDAYIIIAPIAENAKVISLKNELEIISFQKLKERFNTRISIAHMQLLEETETMVTTTTTHPNQALLFSPSLHQALLYRQGGMFLNEATKKLPSTSPHIFKESWHVTMINLETVHEWSSKLRTTVKLPPCSFSHTHDVIPYLNQYVQNAGIVFEIDKNSYLTLHMREKDSSIVFSDTLRDIFAFDKNQYDGVGKYRASDALSLTRRIHYLYVYSNISDYVRVGNTEVPLLAVFPFESGGVCDNLVEKTFVVPM